MKIFELLREIFLKLIEKDKTLNKEFVSTYLLSILEFIRSLNSSQIEEIIFTRKSRIMFMKISTILKKQRRHQELEEA